MARETCICMACNGWSQFPEEGVDCHRCDNKGWVYGKITPTLAKSEYIFDTAKDAALTTIERELGLVDASATPFEEPRGE